MFFIELNLILGKTWEKLGTFNNGFQLVIKNNGNLVGITWEKLN